MPSNREERLQGFWSRDAVRRAVELLWPDGQPERILQVLDQYEGDTPQGRARVQLALLILSDRDHQNLQDLVQHANLDYRDILYWAEYPEQASFRSIAWSKLTPEERLAVVRRDREELLAWLEKHAGVV